MSKQSEQEFERIAEGVIGQADRVKCSIAEYVDGLKIIIEMLQESVDAAEAGES